MAVLCAVEHSYIKQRSDIAIQAVRNFRALRSYGVTVRKTLDMALSILVSVQSCLEPNVQIKGRCASLSLSVR